jgi:hypothetical protein
VLVLDGLAGCLAAGALCRLAGWSAKQSIYRHGSEQAREAHEVKVKDFLADIRARLQAK